MGVYHEYTSALPLTLGPVMSGLFFYSLGQSFKSKNLLTKLSTHLNTIAIVVILGIFVFISEINSEVNFYICQYGIFFLFISGALFGIMGIITLCIRIGKRLGNLKMIRTISIGTLLICGFHLMIFSLITRNRVFYFPYTAVSYDRRTCTRTSICTCRIIIMCSHSGFHREIPKGTNR